MNRKRKNLRGKDMGNEYNSQCFKYSNVKKYTTEITFILVISSINFSIEFGNTFVSMREIQLQI